MRPAVAWPSARPAASSPVASPPPQLGSRETFAPLAARQTFVWREKNGVSPLSRRSYFSAYCFPAFCNQTAGIEFSRKFHKLHCCYQSHNLWHHEKYIFSRISPLFLKSIWLHPNRRDAAKPWNSKKRYIMDVWLNTPKTRWRKSNQSFLFCSRNQLFFSSKLLLAV